MIAAYNYSLSEIEERLFCRAIRAKFPAKSNQARCPEPRLHFALSLGCASSPNIRIYDSDTLDSDLETAAKQYLQANAPKNQVAIKLGKATGAITEIWLPKPFKWFQDDFGFSKQEILSYYASFMPPGMKDDVLELARKANFLIKYAEYDWNLYLSKACAEVVTMPERKMSAVGNVTARSHESDKSIGSNRDSKFQRSPHEVISKKMVDWKLKDEKEQDDDYDASPALTARSVQSANPKESSTVKVALIPTKSSNLPDRKTTNRPEKKALGTADNDGFLC